MKLDGKIQLVAVKMAQTALSFAVTGVALAQVERCEQLAASKYDTQRRQGVAGVNFDDIQPQPAIEACQRAVRSAPSDAVMYFNLGRAFVAARRYPDALNAYQKAASLRHNLALVNIGGLYEDGRGVPQSYQESMNYYLKASTNGSPLAAHYIGTLIENGLGVVKDESKAFTWYLRAAQLGVDLGSFRVAQALDNGELGQKQDKALAFQWYVDAARRGHLNAHWYVSYALRTGTGVATDKENAFKWAERGASLGSSASLNDLGLYFLAEVDQFKLESIKPNGRRAYEYFIQGAQRGSEWANYSLILCYLGDSDCGVNKNFSEASRLIDAISKPLPGESMRLRGYTYLKGLGVEKDIDKARQWYTKAAEAGDSLAKQVLADLNRPAQQEQPRRRDDEGFICDFGRRADGTPIFGTMRNGECYPI